MTSSACSALPRLPGVAAVLSVSLAGWVAGPAVAHNPHDPVDVIALSPDFGNDETLIIAQRPAVNWRFMDALVSLDAGASWSLPAAGLDNVAPITSAAISPGFGTDGVAVLATLGDGLFLSTDGAASWARLPVTAGSGFSWVALADDVAANYPLFALSSSGTLYRSDDLGASLDEIWSGDPFEIVVLSPDIDQDGTLLAATELGALQLSSDLGATWQPLGAFPGPATVTSLLIPPGFASDGEIFVGTALAGALVSRDGGLSFQPVDNPLWTGAVTALGASPAYAQDGTLFLATASEAVFKSTDGGLDWTHHDLGVELSDQSSTHFRGLWPSPAFAVDQTLFLSAWEGLFRSRDGGVTWVEMETRPPGLYTAVALLPSSVDDTTVAVSSYRGGVIVSGDRGDTWTISNLGLGSDVVYDLDFGPTQGASSVLLGNHQGALVGSPSKGSQWARRSLASVSPSIVFPTDIAVSPGFWSDHTIFVGTRSDGLLVTDDAGTNWSLSLAPVPGHRIASVVLSPAFPADPLVFVSTSEGVVARSTDGGVSWAPVIVGLPTARGPAWLAISPAFATDRQILAGTVAGLHRSFDAGLTWSPVPDPVAGVAPVEAIALSPAFGTDGTGYLSLRGLGLFKSTDGGATWAASGGGLLGGDNQVSFLAVSGGGGLPNRVFGIAREKIVRSIDAGLTWDVLVPLQVRHEESSQSVSYTGSWSRPKSSAVSSGSAELSTQTGAEATFRFFGTGVSWRGVRAPILGIADVYLDGSPVASVDQYGPATVFGVTHYSVDGLPRGEHELRVVVAGEGAGGPTSLGVAVDAFDLHR